jgi:hypothetical protein
VRAAVVAWVIFSPKSNIIVLSHLTLSSMRPHAVRHYVMTPRPAIPQGRHLRFT